MADPAMMFDSLMSALIDPGTWFFSAISILLAALAIWLISKLVDIRDKPIVWVISAAALPAFASALLAGFNDQFGNELFARTAIILLIIFLAGLVAAILAQRLIARRQDRPAQIFK